MVRPQSLRCTALLLSLCILASGCLSGAETDTAGPKGAPVASATGYVEQSQAPIPSQANTSAGLGVIQGIVVNDNEAALVAAAIVIPGTNYFTKTDEQGRFAFLDVPPQTYRLRVDKDKYVSVEENVHVTADQVTFVRVVMVSADPLVGGFREHYHNFWGDKTIHTLIDDTFTWTPDSSNSKGATVNDPCVRSTQGAATDRSAECALMRIPVGDTLVYPGAAQLVVTASWKQQDYVKEIYFQYNTANYSHAYFASLDYASSYATTKRFGIKNGETKILPLVPKDADNGHARYTAWRFQMGMNFTVGGQVVNHQDLIRREVGPIKIKIEVTKGELQPDPAHPRFWADGPRYTVVNAVKRELTTAQYNRDPSASGSGGLNVPYWLPNGQNLVPPGATHLEVTLKYRTDQPPLEGQFSKKTLAFRTATLRSDLVKLSDLRVEAPKQKDAGTTTYQLALKPEETDSFYQFHSVWMFLLANDGQERSDTFRNECISISNVGCGKGHYELTVVAINGNFEEDFKAGRI